MIETERLLLRRWRDADRAPFAAMNRDPAVLQYLGPPWTREQSDAAVDRMNAFLDAGEPAFLAAERKADGAFIGFVGVKPITFDAPFAPGYEIGWRLTRDVWGQGLASEGAAAALDHAFRTLPVHAVHAITVPANQRSQAVMRRIGMRRVEGGDFDHPSLTADSPLRRHVHYRIGRSEHERRDA